MLSTVSVSEKASSAQKVKKQLPKQKKVTNQSKKRERKYSKEIMPNIKEYFSLTEIQMVSKSNTSDKQKIEVETNDDDNEGVLCFICNDEEVAEDIEDGT